MIKLDFYVDNITAPIVEPILKIWEQEGATFLSTFKNTTPWVVEA